MLILASNTDRLQIVTGSAGSIDAHASWMDNVAGAVAPGRTNTANIATAALTTIVPPPAVGVQRNIKTLHIRNKAVSAQAVTVVHTDGTTAVELHKGILQPNTSLQYIDEIGFVGDPASSQPPGSFVLIENQQITTAKSFIEFKTGIDDTYDLFVMRCYNIRFPIADWPYLRVSSDLGATWLAEANGYQFLQVYASTTGNPPIVASNFNNKMQLMPHVAFASNRLGNQCNFQFAQPWDQTLRHMFMIDSVVVQETDGMVRSSAVGEFFGNPFRTIKFNAIQFLSYNGSAFIGGSFTLYGVKK